MPYPDESRLAVLGYLHREFGVEAPSHATPTGALAVSVTFGEAEHAVEFSADFLNQHAPEELPELLTQWKLAEQMRGAEGMRLAVSDSGVHVASFN